MAVITAFAGDVLGHTKSTAGRVTAENYMEFMVHPTE
jgi:hypothetical protein